MREEQYQIEGMHCAACSASVERVTRKYGEGRRPTLRQIEKEGYYWARQGLFDQDSAARYLKTWREKQQGQAAYMQVLGLGQRRPVASEEKYISDWMDKGFPPETVALAYDKTVFYKKQLEWRYLNGILRRWHENGWHTEEEVRQSDSRKPSRRVKFSVGPWPALMRTSSAGPSSSGSGSSVCFAGSRSWRISTAACAAP